MATAYSLRDMFSIRTHGIVKDDTLRAAVMGHTVAVHHRSYWTTEWSSTDSFCTGRGSSNSITKQTPEGDAAIAVVNDKLL